MAYELHELLDIIPENELKRVLSYKYCELDGEFMGFTDIYKHLSMIIPKHFTVIDLGCYCAAQCYYFKDHARYIGVDTYEGERFATENTEYYIQTIQEFIAERLNTFDLFTTFAICSYVPDFDAKEKVRNAFDNVYVFYPARIHSRTERR